MDYRSEFERWKKELSGMEENGAFGERDALLDGLNAMDDAAAEAAFCGEMTFGTGGLRGITGPGTNCMNVLTVARASRGLALYLKRTVPGDAAVAVCRDSRIGSEAFSRAACQVFASMGIKVYRFPEIMPTPSLSYAVRALHCAAGVMVTASHNAAKYNGYKVFGPDGCQITSGAAREVSGEISHLDYFRTEAPCSFEEAEARGLIVPVPEETIEDYIRSVHARSVLFGAEADRTIPIVYTPLNGVGLIPVTRVLREAGFTDVRVVEEQREPDGHFPTCPSPNPELPEAMEAGLALCRRTGAELLVATDPDSDRIGIAVRDGDDYRLVTGDETGLLLLDYICGQRARHGKMPERPIFIKTIVTSSLADRIAEKYGVQTVSVLTGFKYIGEKIGQLERAGEEDRFVFAFEESCGYLSGTCVRDKDGVDASLLVCEMAAFYRARGLG